MKKVTMTFDILYHLIIFYTHWNFALSNTQGQFYNIINPDIGTTDSITWPTKTLATKDVKQCIIMCLSVLKYYSNICELAYFAPPPKGQDYGKCEFILPGACGNSSSEVEMKAGMLKFTVDFTSPGKIINRLLLYTKQTI